MSRILVVDDDPDILEVLKIILVQEGFTVRSVPRGEQAIQNIFEFNPELVILDVMMGYTDGRAVCNTIKSTASISNIPVVMISASHDLQEKWKINCSPDAFVAKPFDIQNLVDTVRRTLEAARN